MTRRRRPEESLPPVGDLLSTEGIQMLFYLRNTQRLSSDYGKPEEVDGLLVMEDMYMPYYLRQTSRYLYFFERPVDGISTFENPYKDFPL